MDTLGIKAIVPGLAKLNIRDLFFLGTTIYGCRGSYLRRVGPYLMIDRR